MSKRIYTNREIQETIARVISEFSQSDLNKYCRITDSKRDFNLNFSLLYKVPYYHSKIEKSKMVKDHNGIARWTWKFEFTKNGYVYAISTQWYARNDAYVQSWLKKHDRKQT